jgi:hypothetical protein
MTDSASQAPALRRIVALVALCIGVIAVRTPFLGVPMITDEGGYAYWASTWTSQHQLYRDFTFARPQGLLVLYKLIIATLGGTVESIRMAAALFTCMTALVLWTFAREFVSERAAWISALLYAVFSSAPRIEGFTANAEIFTLAPLALNAMLVWSRRWFWAGLVTAIAFQLKPSGVEGCFLIAIWILRELRPASWRPTALAIARSIAGFAAGLAPCIAHGIWVGWGAFWHNLVTMRGEIYSPAVVGLRGQLARIQGGVGDTLSSWIVPALLFALALTQLPREKRHFCLAWLAAAWLGMQAGFWWDWHFFMQLVPPLCFASGAGLLALARARGRVAWGAGLVLALLLFIARDGRLWLANPYQISFAIYRRDGYLVAEQISDYVAKTTAPSDLLYVAFGQAEIYYLSGRTPAVPGQMYYGHALYVDAMWNQVIAAITARTPAVIVWVQPPPPNRMSGRRFAQLILRGYLPDRKFGSVLLFRRKPG